MDLIKDTIFLFMLGFFSWGLFKILKIPVPAFLGTLFVVGGLRATNLPIPSPPEAIYPLVQLMYGLYIGSGLTKEATKKFKELVIPVLIVIVWALSLVFLMGALLNKVTHIDIKTAILSSSMGGLPEMTVLALATDADISIVVIAQSFRMISTFVGLPIIIKYLYKKYNRDETANNENKKISIKDLFLNKLKSLYRKYSNIYKKVISPDQLFTSYFQKDVLSRWKWGLLTLAIALAGGSLFYKIGVPAGMMVGSTFIVALALFLGLNVKTPPKGFLGVIQIGLGLEVSKNISIETLGSYSGQLLMMLILLTLIMCITSFLVALLLYKIAKWEFMTCLLSAAPCGFTVSVALSLDYCKNPLYVSIIQLLRLLSIKIVVPFIFLAIF